MQLILSLRERFGMTVIVASHDPLVVSRCDRVVRISDGVIVEDVELTTDADTHDLLGRIGRLEAP